MKKALIISSLALIMLSCNSADKKEPASATMTPEQIQQAKTDSTKYTTIEWLDSPVKNLGNLKKDQEIEITYRFKNSGDNMLIIEDIIPTCGCTIPEKPQQPFAPGEEGLIKAKFNGSGSGSISKQLTVKANTKPSKDHMLTFTGEIKE